MPALTRPATAALLILCAGLWTQGAGAKEGLAGAYLAAKVAAANADFRAADMWFRRAEGLEQFHPEILQGQMISALSLGDLPRASALADTLIDVGVFDQNATLAQMALRAQAKDYDGILQAIGRGESLGVMLDGLLAGWSHIGLGRMNDGLASFDALAKTQGLAGFGQYHRAMALAQAGDFEGARAALEAPETELLLSMRRGAIFYCEILSQLGKFDEAMAFLTARFASGGDPKLQDVMARLSKAEALPLAGFDTANFGFAEAFFGVASSLGSDTDAAYTLLHARIASVLRPDDTEAILLTASLLERKSQFDLAAETYAKVPQSHPDYAIAEVGRADAIFAAGRGEESLDILRALAETQPQNLDVLVALGNGLRRAENHKDAIAAYDAALALVPAPSPIHWPIFYSRGISHESSGDFTSAEADFRQALALSPDQPSVLNYLGYSLVDRGEKLDEALGMITRAVAAQPESGYIVDSLAWAYFRLGRFADALEPMERASLLEPVDPIVTDHLGDVYWANGRKREAQFQWRRALSFSPKDSDAERIRKKLEIGLDAVRESEGDAPFPPLGAGGR